MARKPSIAKSFVAQNKPRVGGRFVSLKDEEDKDKEEHPALEVSEEFKKPKRGRPPKTKEISKDELIYDTRLFTEEEKEYIGSDALRFYEIALKRARTCGEGHRAAAVLIKYQHPSLSAIATKNETEITQKVLTWEWGGNNETIDFDPETSILDGEEITDDDTKDTNSVSTSTISGVDTQESE